MLSKEASDSHGCIELRGTREAVALSLVDLDLMWGALFLQQTLHSESMRVRHDAI